MGDLVFVIAIGALAAAIGVGLGIFFFAPRIRRALDRAESQEAATGDGPTDDTKSDNEEPGDRPD